VCVFIYTYTYTYTYIPTYTNAYIHTHIHAHTHTRTHTHTHTLAQVVTGDSWASSVTRGLFTGKENEPWISFMMISYVLIGMI
jgi:hypothetical protein